MLALAAALALPLADSAAAGDFLPHRAVYALTRAGSRASQTVAQIGGTMMIELDESCEGWSLSQRVRLTLIDALGDEVESDSRYASYETKDGTMLRFQSADWKRSIVPSLVS